MYQIKKVKLFTTCVFALLIGLAFTLQNCNEYDSSTLEEIQNSTELSSKNGKSKDKIDICHYDAAEDRWFIISINENAWKGHQSHGDVRLDEERMAIGRALLEVQSTNVSDVLPYYADNIEYHDPIVDIYGIEDMTAFLDQLIIGASPDLVTTVDDETYIDGVYSATWTMEGSFNGIPYTAKGISIFKFVPDCSNKVYYQRDYYSEGDIMATIPGLDQAIGGFRTYYRCAVDPIFNCPPGFPVTTATNSTLGVQNQLNNDQLVVGRQLVEINAQNWTNVIPYLLPEYEYYDPIVHIEGPDTMAEFLGRLFAGSSSLYTIVEDETIVDDIYMATWTMSGMFNGAPFSAPGMSIVKFDPGTTNTYYSRDYYTEGDVMLGVPELAPAVIGFRQYYLSTVDPNYQ